jgi:hypothetical protein
VNATEALKITVNAIQVDATLSGETVNLNRVTFWLSELSYGRKWFNDSLSMAGNNDIVRTAAAITDQWVTASQLVTFATEGK